MADILSTFNNTFLRKKTLAQALADRDDEEKSLKKCLSAWDLILLGLGWIIGAGIFVITGVAAHSKAGPAIVLSYIFTGAVCVFSAFCFAEFAARVPIAGSAYTCVMSCVHAFFNSLIPPSPSRYAYTTVGEFPAWIIGWDLTLEYLIGSAAVARYYLHCLLIVFEILHSKYHCS